MIKRGREVWDVGARLAPVQGERDDPHPYIARMASTRTELRSLQRNVHMAACLQVFRCYPFDTRTNLIAVGKICLQRSAPSSRAGLLMSPTGQPESIPHSTQVGI